MGSSLAPNQTIYVCKSRGRPKGVPLEFFGTMRLIEVKKIEKMKLFHNFRFLRFCVKKTCFPSLEGTSLLLFDAKELTIMENIFSAFFDRAFFFRNFHLIKGTPRLFS